MPLKAILVAINAKFIHSNLAVRYLKKYCEQNSPYKIDVLEFTINQPIELILREIYKAKPDILGISCYIWNYTYVVEITRELKKLLPSCVIMLGGPEVSYNASEVITQTNADFVLIGEGEKSFTQLVCCINNGEKPDNIHGIAYKSDKGIVENPSASPIALDEIPFVYGDDADPLENKIIYYESSRGCPFNCQYCLSSSSGGVRFLSLERVFADINYFLRSNVSQVKFVDRTFNCNKNHTMAIIQNICENDNGITNFHFEIAAELLDDDMLALLKTARKGLFQLEIGVQSTFEKTLSAIKRVTLPKKLTSVIKSLQSGNNIHLHLDLIAGLPHEDYEHFKASFNYVYSLAPNQLQLGFLKLLKGSGLYADKEKYGLECRFSAPYEVLFTDALSYDDLLALKMVEEMVELYYNSGRYCMEIAYLVSLYAEPFDFFEALSRFYEENGFHLAPHSKVEYYDILLDFLSCTNADKEHFKWLALYDIYSHEKAKKLPTWLNMRPSKEFGNAVYDFTEQNKNVYFSDYAEYDVKQILRMVHFELFPFNPKTGEKRQTAILFRYKDGEIIEINTNTKH